jgi:hypothetical protein
MWRAVCALACAVALSGCASLRAGAGSSVADATPRPQEAGAMLGYNLDVGADVSWSELGELWVGYRWHKVSELVPARVVDGRALYAARALHGPYLETVIQLIEEDDEGERAALGVGIGGQVLMRPQGEGIEGFFATMRLQFEEQGVSFEREQGLGFSTGRLGAERLWQITPLGVELKMYDLREMISPSDD